MAAIGKGYLACTAAGSGAGCSNRTSARRLKSQLMEPQFVEKLIFTELKSGSAP
jgi:hypothetical protein